MIQRNNSEIFFLQSSQLRMKTRVRSLTEKLMEFSQSGSMKAICHQFTKADEEGKFEDEFVLRDMLETVARNLHVKKQGKQYKASTQMFFVVLLIWDGPGVATFVSNNMFGPEIHSVFCWRKEHSLELETGLTERNLLL